jgi:hypothetical protein
LKIKPKQLFQKIETLKENNQAAITYLLFETYPDKAEDNHIQMDILRSAGFKVYDATKIKQNFVPPMLAMLSRFTAFTILKPLLNRCCCPGKRMGIFYSETVIFARRGVYDLANVIE